MSSEHSSTSSSAGRVPTSHTVADPVSVEEHGRRFQAYREGKYMLPNDGDEQDRLDVQHKVWYLLMKGKLYWAPIDQPENVLDLGTGTGIWAINFARQHPQAQVIGTDLSMIQPTSTAPANCTFFRDDAEELWVFDTQFDFIHLRLMTTCFDHPRDVMQIIYNSLRPGGWAEYQDSTVEIVGAEPESEAYVQASPVARMMSLMRLGMRNATGRDVTVPRKYKQWMIEIGFVDVVEVPLLIPTNSWPLDPDDQHIGHFTRLDVEKALGATTKILLAAGMTQEEVPEFLESVRWSLGDAGLRGYYIGYVVYGRKPGGPSQVAAPVAAEAQLAKPQE
ncbi:unnamed protein product [Discula destructiva]